MIVTENLVNPKVQRSGYVMEDSLSKAEVKKNIKSTIFTVITHSLLPLTLVPFAFFVVPFFTEKAREVDIELHKLTILVFNLSSFICQHLYLCVLIIGFAITLDAMICFSLLRLKKKMLTHLWSGLVILIEAVFVGLCVFALVLSLHRMSNAPWLCPI